MVFLIGLTGFARSGKDTVASYLVKNYGFKAFAFSDIIIEHLKKMNREVTKENMSLLGDELRKEFGNDVMAQFLWERVKNFDKIVITGFRSPAEVAFFKAKTRCILIYVEADAEIRFRRRTAEDPETKKAFFERDERDKKNKGLDVVIDEADYTLENNGTKEELYRRVDYLWKKIGPK